MIRPLLSFVIAARVVSCVGVATPPAGGRGWVQPTEYEVRTRGIWVDPAFTEAQRAEISRAITEWNFALNGRLVFSARAADYPEDTSTVSVYRVGADCTFRPKDAIAWVDHLGGHLVYVVPDLFPPGTSFGGVMKHEIGHVLGADHLSSGLMRGDNLSDACIDGRVQVQVAAHLRLRLRDLAWCDVP